MIKKTALIGLAASMLVAGCGYEMTEGQAKDVVVIEDTKEIKASAIKASKIERIENMTGYEWLDKNSIITAKVNPKLDTVKIDTNKMKAEFGVQNIFVYDLELKAEAAIGDHSKFQDSPKVSKDGRYVYYVNSFEKKDAGYIWDSRTEKTVKISDRDIDGYDLAESSWTDQNEIVMTMQSKRGFALAGLDGKIKKMEDVETGVMSNVDPLKGRSLIDPVKIGDRIYYTNIYRGNEDDGKLKMYDAKTNKTTPLFDDMVMDFEVSQARNSIVMISYNEKKNVNELLEMDLDGSNRIVLDSGYMYGIDVSPDGSKVAYVSGDDRTDGLYVLDMESKKSELALAGECYTPIKWSPDSKKVMVHTKKSKNNGRPFDEIEVTSIVSFE